jgi:hypothetical protein
MDVLIEQKIFDTMYVFSLDTFQQKTAVLASVHSQVYINLSKLECGKDVWTLDMDERFIRCHHIHGF